ncbi:pilus assembly protein [Devosia sp. PTR5]|uniref:Pilus assembly protein n=1 Tax=Devosia oryzisoli TaxID=2774138 RepID=A0A927FV46_9HYPH|nr:pilus assembly protein [Devosia oryzisoli]
MRKLIAGLGSALRDRAGTAAVEFALIVPIMLLVYVGTMEASSLITMDRKIQSVSGAVGDLVARADKVLTTNQLKDYFQAASGIMTPFSSSGVKQVVTAVNVAPDGSTSVEWTSQYQNGTYSTTTEYTPGQTYPLPAPMIAVAKGKMVIAAEASYSYKPLYGIVFDQAVTLSRAGFFMPRFEGTIDLD